jgi:phosphatidylglycerophosphate synthase
MKLHRATRSDWSQIAPQERNLWQRWAAGSHGVITPGNIVSLLGAALVVRGLFYLGNGQLVAGIWTVLLGRVADILDGMVADYTKTKSPLGEAIDASFDKTLLVLALIVLLDKHYLPLFVGIVMAVHAVYNIVVSSIARSFKINLHPSRAGKLCAGAEWLCVGLYLLVDILRQYHHDTTVAHGAALISFGLFVITAIWSSRNYTRNVYYKRVMGS